MCSLLSRFAQNALLRRLDAPGRARLTIHDKSLMVSFLSFSQSSGDEFESISVHSWRLEMSLVHREAHDIVYDSHGHLSLT